MIRLRRLQGLVERKRVYYIDCGKGKKMFVMPLVADFVPVNRNPKRYHMVVTKLMGLLLAVIVAIYYFSPSNTTKSAQTMQDSTIANELRIISITASFQAEIEKMSAKYSQIQHSIEEEINKASLMNDLMNAKFSEMEQSVDEKIKKALALYEADKLGIIDYALESGGGGIISTPETITYPSKVTFSMFGMIHLRTYSNPRVILQASTMPGECYAFIGQRGRFRIKLSVGIEITAISMEHAHFANLVDTRSAPRDFIIYGLENDSSTTGDELGQFVYDIDGDPLQTFHLDANTDVENLTSNLGCYPNKKAKSYQYVELSILSNYGHPEYTCLYRFRVHGKH